MRLASIEKSREPLLVEVQEIIWGIPRHPERGIPARLSAMRGGRSYSSSSCRMLYPRQAGIQNLSGVADMSRLASRNGLQYFSRVLNCIIPPDTKWHGHCEDESRKSSE